MAGRNPFGRYAEDVDVDAGACRRLLAGHAAAFLARPDAEQAALPNGRGLALFRLSQWDSEHFGFPFAMIDSIQCAEKAYAPRLAQARRLVGAVLARLRARKARFVSLRVSQLDLSVVHALEEAGFSFIESWIYNKRDLRRLPPPAEPALTLRLARPQDEAAMLACCPGAFDTQRFHADLRFPRAKAENLYRKWIVSSFRDPKQKTLVHDVDARPAAFMTYYENDQSALFGLRFAMWKMALIAPDQRGKGLGRRFFEALFNHHRADGLDVVDSGLTTRNVASLNLHNRCGFKTIATMLTFHKWLD